MRLKEYLRQKKLTASRFALKAEIAPSQILDLINGKRQSISFEQAVRIINESEGAVYIPDLLEEIGSEVEYYLKPKKVKKNHPRNA